MVSSELKRRQKAEAKIQQKAAQQTVQPKVEKSEKISEEEVSPNEYFKLRTQAVAKLKELDQSRHPYPHKFHVSISLEDFIDKYSNLQPGNYIKFHLCAYI